MGQSVQQYDPKEPPQPPQNDPGPINRADDPHWQCSLGAQFYGGFTGMPYHCQQKIFASAGTTLPWENEMPESPKKITEDEQPASAKNYLHNSSSDRMLGYALKSSAKAGNDKNRVATGINETVEVKIPALDMEVIPGFVDASVSGDTWGKYQARRLTSDEVSAIKKNVQNHLTKDCVDFISKLIKQLTNDLETTAISTNILEVFDRVASSDGPDHLGTKNGGIWGYLEPTGTSNAYFNWKTNNASIALHQKIFSADSLAGTNAENPTKHQKLENASNAITVIHELLHNSVFTGAQDIRIASTILGFTGEELFLDGNTNHEGKPLSDDEKRTQASNVFDLRLGEACGVPGLRIGMSKYIRKKP